MGEWTADSAAYQAGTSGETPSWWPPGCAEALVRDCAATGCERCQALLHALQQYRAGVAPTGEDATLAAFGGEEA